MCVCVCVSVFNTCLCIVFRNNIELIEKTEQLVRELKHIDSTQAQW